MQNTLRDALRPNLYSALTEDVRNALRSAVDRASENSTFDMNSFVLDIATKNDCEVNQITRLNALEAVAELAVTQQDGGAATDAQKRALERFRLNPANFPTKAEASEMLDLLIRRANARREQNASA